MKIARVDDKPTLDRISQLRRLTGQTGAAVLRQAVMGFYERVTSATSNPENQTLTGSAAKAVDAVSDDGTSAATDAPHAAQAKAEGDVSFSSPQPAPRETAGAGLSQDTDDSGGKDARCADAPTPLKDDGAHS